MKKQIFAHVITGVLDKRGSAPSARRQGPPAKCIVIAGRFGPVHGFELGLPEEMAAFLPLRRAWAIEKTPMFQRDFRNLTHLRTPRRRPLCETNPVSTAESPHSCEHGVIAKSHFRTLRRGVNR